MAVIAALKRCATPNSDTTASLFETAEPCPTQKHFAGESGVAFEALPYPNADTMASFFRNR